MKSPVKIIREHCLDCSNGQPSEVTACPCTKCKLWPYRFGKNPFIAKKNLSDEQRGKIRQRLARGKSIVGTRGFEQGGQISRGDQ